MLEPFFQGKPYPAAAEKKALAEKAGMQPEEVRWPAWHAACGQVLAPESLPAWSGAELSWFLSGQLF